MSIETSQIQSAFQNYQNGNVIQAELGVRQILANSQNHYEALRLGALTALALKQVTTAHQRLLNAINIRPMDAETANTLGNILKASGDWVEAENAYLKAKSLDSNYQPVNANYVDLLVQSGQPKRALEELERQSKASKVTDLMRLARANALMNLGEFQPAMECLKSINASYEPDKVAMLKTRLLFHMGDYADMENTAKSISDGSEFMSEALSVVVNAHVMQGHEPLAYDFINGICNRPYVQPRSFVKAAQLLTRNENQDLANEIMLKAENKFGSQADILAEKANRAFNAGEIEPSYQLYKEALSLRPGDFSIMTNFAQTALVAGKYAECQGLIQGALQQAPNNQFVLALAASLLRAKGEAHNTLYNYEDYIRVYDLKVPPGYTTMEAFNQGLKTCLERYHQFENAPLNQSLRGGTQTDRDLYYLDDPILKVFFESLDDPIRDYMKHIGHNKDHPLSRRNTGDYRFNGAWSVRLSPNGHHVNHVHPMGWISSSYYVDVPDIVETSENKEGWIKFGQPGIKGLDQAPEKFVQPQPGRLVLFPSYMWHGTVAFSGQQSRLTLPFDVLPA